MKLFGVFNHRFRGFRVVELGAAGVLLALVLVVYLAKAGAGGERAAIARVEDEIVAERTQIRLLNAEVASQEQPERLAALSTRYLGLQPIAAKREVPADALPDVAHLAAAASPPTPPVAAQPVVARSAIPGREAR